MNKPLLKMLEKERDQLSITLAALDHLIATLQSGQPISLEEVKQVLHRQFTRQAAYGFPYFGTYSDKILFAVEKLGRFSRKEDVVAKIWEYQQFQKLDNISTILSRLVNEGRMVSLKYNASNLYVFYGLPSFTKLPRARIRKGHEPEEEELADIRIKGYTMQCGGPLNP